MSIDVVKVEIVKASYDANKFELKVYHGDNSWMFFSRGFATKTEARKVASKLSQNVQEVA